MKHNGVIELVLFDFGGVVAEEGFREGLWAIAEKNGIDREAFLQGAVDAIVDSGYLTGGADEQTFWEILRRTYGLRGTDDALRREILDRFVIRPWMLDAVRKVRGAGARTALLSDQTNWLDELEGQHGFFRHFEKIFNSFHTGKSKYDASLFDDVLQDMKVQPEKALFIDDNRGHIGRASERGLHTICFTERESFSREIAPFFPALTEDAAGLQ